ncbi:MAG: glycosyltransferase family 2 protein [Acidobacteria bacterium]|jgi:glycosyltransferase involved in cell wall biosynthesis|nr:glycosyltransferase family 2 protein [Acidobacteriota bacterium]
MKPFNSIGNFNTLSIVIPVYNEEKTIEKLITSVLSVPLSLEKEIVIVDDCSTDGTLEIVTRISENQPRVKIFKNEKNKGKGFSVRRGINESTGEIIIIQDADLEYDPAEFPKLLKPILEGKADVVFGSRFATTEARRVLYFWHAVANRLLTLFSNMFSNLNLTDMETCYKMFVSGVIKQIRLTENRFGFEPEVTFKLSKLKGLRIYEVGISYHGRTYAEGKKIGWKDGFRAFYVLLKNATLYFFRKEKHIYK